MIDETDRHTGLGADGADRQSLVTVALETHDGGRNQRLATLLRQLGLETRFARAPGPRRAPRPAPPCSRPPPQPPAAKIAEDLARRVVPRGARHAAARMRAGAAHIE